MSKHNRQIFISVLIHSLVWIAMLLLAYAFTVGAGRSWNELIIHFWLQIFLLAVIFYLNYFFFVRKWLFGHQKWLLILVNLGLILLFVWLRHDIIEWNKSETQKMDGPKPPPFVFRFFIDGLIYTIPVAFAIAIHSIKRWAKIDDLRKESENIKLQSELQHLKYQLQPHFFFNSLNNTYALIDSDPEKAKQTIHSLSKLMRHLLSSSEQEKVTLHDEVEFLKKYITLMTIRQGTSVTIDSRFPDTNLNIMIAPLLFVSIVENAFKHGVSASQASHLFFDMKVDNGVITFLSRNDDFPKANTDMSGSGIGIENLRKRLNLLYPNKHKLTIEVVNHEFVVLLMIDTK